jgi:hypothetical protein
MLTYRINKGEEDKSNKFKRRLTSFWAANASYSVKQLLLPL